jgi:hypothetical protein
MLLNLPPERLKKLIDGYENEVNDIKKNALQMAWYMRGSVSYQDILNMSITERKHINTIIEQNLETTKKTQLPFF